MQSGGVCIPVNVIHAGPDVIRLMFKEMPLDKRRELVQIVMAHAYAWLTPPYPRDRPLRSFASIVRCVFELFYNTWKERGRNHICHFRMMVSLLATSADVHAAKGEASTSGQDKAAPLYRLPPLPAPTLGNDDGHADADDTANSAGYLPPSARGSQADAGGAANNAGSTEAGAHDGAGLPFYFPPPTLDVASEADISPTGLSLAPLNLIDYETISIAEMGQPNGLTLSGGQLQSGIIFTLAQNQVVTNARLSLALKVSPALAARDTSLLLMLNGQALGSIRLN